VFVAEVMTVVAVMVVVVVALTEVTVRQPATTVILLYLFPSDCLM
jgi:hypothetical protein